MNRTIVYDEFYRENDNIYINLSESNLVGPSSGLNLLNNPVYANFNIQNDEPFFVNSSEFYCSIVRFDIPLDTIPTLIAPVQPFPNTNPNLTKWGIGIDLNGAIFIEPLVWQPELSVPPIIPSLDNPEPVSDYFFMYSYQTLINMMNVAVSKACVAAGVATPPLFQLDQVTGIVSVIVPAIYTTLPGTPSEQFVIVPGRPNIVMNWPLFNYFYSFPFHLGSGVPITYVNNGFYYLTLNGYYFPPAPNDAFYYPGTPTNIPPTNFKFSQEFSVLNTWAAVREILFLTGRIPVNNESITTANNDSSTTRIPILTDFSPIVNKAGDNRSIAYYVPSGQYRLSDMISTLPLQSIDVNIFWRDLSGRIFPLSLNIGRQINIKLAFLRKDLYKGKGK